MADQLTAMILGAGFASQGHTIALRAAGVDVIGMASRTDDVCRKVAAEFEIPEAGTDWRTMLQRLKPDIVAVGTPGGVHRDMCGAALESGCHVLCDKPLATTASDAKELYELARDNNLKTGYAASYRYQPQTLYARELVASGILGNVCEAEFVSHYHWPSLMPYGWPHQLENGGGRLNNNFTHKMAIAQNILGGEVFSAMGECRNDLKRVPIAQKIHDFRDYFTQALTPEEAADCDWADVTSDWSYTVLARIGNANKPAEDAVTVTFRHSGLRFGKNADYVAIYGDKGTLHIEEAYTQGPMYLRTDGEDWEELTIPQHIFEQLPDDDDPTQRNWSQLAIDLVDDIQGTRSSNYLTFRDGWIYQEIIDIVRAGGCWNSIAQQ